MISRSSEMMAASTRRRSAPVAAWLAISVAVTGAALAVKTEPMSDAEAAEFVRAPRALVDETVGRVLEVLDQEDLASAERRRQIQVIAFDVFDFATMGKLALARSWRQFDADQRIAFVAEFKVHLSRNYGSRLDRYEQTDVEVVKARLEPRNDVTVFSKVIGGQFDGIEMNYRLRKRGEDWLVIDVVIEGVSLIGNFRSQFKEVVSRGGPDLLLEKMREKNAAPIKDADSD
jgi:phospholipid transport system substrate-binding protein